MKQEYIYAELRKSIINPPSKEEPFEFFNNVIEGQITLIDKEILKSDSENNQE